RLIDDNGENGFVTIVPDSFVNWNLNPSQSANSVQAAISALMSTRPSVLNRAIVLGNRSGHLLPPSPPAEKATARQDQTRQSSTCDGGGNYHPSASQVSTDIPGYRCGVESNL